MMCAGWSPAGVIYAIALTVYACVPNKKNEDIVILNFVAEFAIADQPPPVLHIKKM
jgi:hypothetical protein